MEHDCSVALIFRIRDEYSEFNSIILFTDLYLFLEIFMIHISRILYFFLDSGSQKVGSDGENI